MQVAWKAGKYVVRVIHGSGDGRSFGGAEIYHSPAERDGWARDSQTTEWFVYDTQAGANEAVDFANWYYDGSDY